MKEMKIVKETKFNEKDWYSLYIDDRYITGSYDEEKVNSHFEAIKDNPNAFLQTKETVKTTFIDIN
jgi:hypothetical protein